MPASPLGEEEDAAPVAGTIAEEVEKEETVKEKEDLVQPGGSSSGGGAAGGSSVILRMRQVGALLREQTVHESRQSLREGKRAVASGEMSEQDFLKVLRELRRDTRNQAAKIELRVREEEEMEAAAREERLRTKKSSRSSWSSSPSSGRSKASSSSALALSPPSSSTGVNIKQRRAHRRQQLFGYLDAIRDRSQDRKGQPVGTVGKVAEYERSLRYKMTQDTLKNKKKVAKAIQAAMRGNGGKKDWRLAKHGDGTFDNVRVLDKPKQETSNDEVTAAAGEAAAGAGAAAVGFNETERECAARQKVCVGFFGITRSTKVTHRSAWRHVLNPIKDAGAQLKIFLHTYGLSHVQNDRAGESNVTLDGEEWKLLKPTTKMFEKQDRALDNKLHYQAVLSMLNGGKFAHYEFMSDLAFKGTMMNIGRQGHSLYQVSKLMRGHNCTRVVLSRPDVMFVNDVDTRRLLQCDMPDNTWYIPDFAHWGGVNDRLAFGRYNAMKAYGNMLHHMKDFSMRRAMQKESFLYAYSVKTRMRIKLFDMCFVRIRANHQPASLDVGQCCDSFARTAAELDDLEELGINVVDREDTYGILTAVCAEKKIADDLQLAAKLAAALAADANSTAGTATDGAAVVTSPSSLVPLGQRSMGEVEEAVVAAAAAAAANAATEEEGFRAAVEAVEALEATVTGEGGFEAGDSEEAALAAVSENATTTAEVVEDDDVSPTQTETARAVENAEATEAEHLEAIDAMLGKVREAAEAMLEVHASARRANESSSSSGTSETVGRTSGTVGRTIGTAGAPGPLTHSTELRLHSFACF